MKRRSLWLVCVPVGLLSTQCFIPDVNFDSGATDLGGAGGNDPADGMAGSAGSGGDASGGGSPSGGTTSAGGRASGGAPATGGQGTGGDGGGSGGAGGSCQADDEATACAGLCGQVTSCDQQYDCGGCSGEASCSGAGEANMCGCAAAPCGLTQGTWGDADDEWLVDLAVSAQGEVFFLGDFGGSVTFGGTTHTHAGTWSDVYLVKLDANGEVLWSKSFGNSNQTTASALAIDGTGNVIIVGSGNGDIDFGGGAIAMNYNMFIAKFSGDGVHQFSAAYGTSVEPRSVAIDLATNDIFVTGEFYNTLKFGSLSSLTHTGTDGYEEMFLVQFYATGEPKQAKRYGGNLAEYPHAVASSGDYVFTAGTFADSMSFGGSSPTLTATGWGDLFVAKLAHSAFFPAWSFRMGDAGPSGYAVDFVDLDADPAGDVYLAGTFTGTLEFQPALTTMNTEMFMAKLDGADGSQVWTKQFVDADPRMLKVGRDGKVYVAGAATGDIDFGGGPRAIGGSRDVFLAKFDVDGSHLYSRVFPAPTGNQYGQAVDATSTGEAWLGVEYEGQLDLGLGAMQVQGGDDIAVAKFAPAP